MNGETCPATSSSGVRCMFPIHDLTEKHSYAYQNEQEAYMTRERLLNEAVAREQAAVVDEKNLLSARANETPPAQPELQLNDSRRAPRPPVPAPGAGDVFDLMRAFTALTADQRKIFMGYAKSVQRMERPK